MTDAMTMHYKVMLRVEQGSEMALNERGDVAVADLGDGRLPVYVGCVSSPARAVRRFSS